MLGETGQHVIILIPSERTCFYMQGHFFFFSFLDLSECQRSVIEVFGSMSALCYFKGRELILFCGGCFHLHLKLHGNNL